MNPMRHVMDIRRRFDGFTGQLWVGLDQVANQTAVRKGVSKPERFKDIYFIVKFDVPQSQITLVYYKSSSNNLILRESSEKF